jgi:hypothetical protein
MQGVEKHWDRWVIPVTLVEIDYTSRSLEGSANDADSDCGKSMDSTGRGGAVRRLPEGSLQVLYLEKVADDFQRG